MTTTPLHPFGVEITVPAGMARDALSISQVREWVARHRLLVLRGCADPTQDEMVEFCRKLGEVLEWEFGAVNELQARDDAKNYLYTPAEVPFHWDGAFVGRVPHYIFFHCRAAPPAGAGGETLFCDTVRLLGYVSEEERERWRGVRITYRTEKVVHYGGTFSADLIGKHPVSGETVVRFAEPVEDLNPVRLTIEGIPEGERAVFLERMRGLLYDPRFCLAHAWRDGDVVIADNHALLHGRRAYASAAPRHLRRVNVL